MSRLLWPWRADPGDVPVTVIGIVWVSQAVLCPVAHTRGLRELGEREWSGQGKDARQGGRWHGGPDAASLGSEGVGRWAGSRWSSVQ